MINTSPSVDSICSLFLLIFRKWCAFTILNTVLFSTNFTPSFEYPVNWLIFRPDMLLYDLFRDPCSTSTKGAFPVRKTASSRNSLEKTMSNPTRVFPAPGAPDMNIRDLPWPSLEACISALISFVHFSMVSISFACSLIAETS